MAGTEMDSALGSLERMRRTFAWKCGDLDQMQMAARIGASTLTLAGLMKHMALVEDHSFGWKFRQAPPAEPFRSIDWDADPDWEFRTAVDDSPGQLFELWLAAVQRSRRRISEAAQGLDTLAATQYPDGSRPSLRRLVFDMIEEYGRHVGHADLLREAVDGRVGEDPPSA